MKRDAQIRQAALEIEVGGQMLQNVQNQENDKMRLENRR